MITIESIQRYCGPSLVRGSSFAYIPPHPLLSPYIANYTVTCPSHGVMADDYTILPTASATLVYSIGSNTITGRLRGINTKAAVVGLHANLFDTLVLIEFHPAGLYPLIGIPQSELLDDSFCFSHLSPQLHKAILDIVLATDHIDSLKNSLDRIFLSHLAGAVINPQLACAIKAIFDTHGSENLNALSKAVFLSARQLERLFMQNLGTGFKTFSRIVRVNHSLRLLRMTNDSMSSIAAEAGYHDQAHFIRDFRALCGTTPQSYLNRMSDFYNDAYKM
jgi:AraC-like DNA-binding protein